MATVAIIVSLDTKAEEALFLRDRIRADGHEVRIVDFGTGTPPMAPDVGADELARIGGGSLRDLAAARDRNAAMDVMMAGAAAWASRAYGAREIDGIISIGGSGGTAVGTAAMRALPLGAPKVMVSTVAASDVRSYVASKDVTMINSVVDFAGVNAISEPVLRNAAAAVGAMAKVARQPATRTGQRLVAASQFGVTTPAIETATKLLAEAGFTLVPFHATGVGGRTMESLIADGVFEAVLDLTTTEWADEVAGGNLTAGPDRLGAAARAGLPQVVAPGALDMANFMGVPVPDKFSARLIHKHNANVALMRTTPAENTEIGIRIAEKLNSATGPVVVLFPARGVSALDAEGQAFYDPAANRALLDSLRNNLSAEVRLEVLDLHINDPAFAKAAVDTLVELVQKRGGSSVRN